MSEGFYRIVVPTDFSTCSHEAWALAQRLAGAFGSELIPVHVLVESPLWGESPFNMERVREVYESARTWGRAELDQWAAQGRRRASRCGRCCAPGCRTWRSLRSPRTSLRTCW